MINLDTHIFLHALAGELKTRERKVLSEHAWAISGIVMWEIEKLHELGRIDIGLHDNAMRRALSRTTVFPVDYKVCASLRALDLTSDPADELIAATSIAHQIPLVTRDRVLLCSKVIPLVD